MEKAKHLDPQTLRQRLFKYNTPRRLVQFLSFIFFSSIVFSLGALPLLFPVLWTWGLKVNTVGDAFTAIQLMTTGWSTSIGILFPWMGIASFLIVGILIGKSMCGWVCPFGFIQDIIGFFRRKQSDVSLRTHQTLVYVKYFVLGIALFIIATFSASEIVDPLSGAAYESALGIFAYAPFTALSPAETLFARLPTMVHNFAVNVFSSQGVNVWSSISSLSALFWAQLVIMVFVLVFVAYVPRSWCRYFCPHGAIMAIMNNFSFIGLKREPTKCEKSGCGHCVQVCPTRVPILDLPWEKFSHPECIYCMKCVDACEHKAIKLTYP
jgi:polyferredoxin